MTQTMKLTPAEAAVFEYNQLEQEMLAMEDLIDLMTEFQRVFDLEFDFMTEDERIRTQDQIHELAQTTKVLPQMEARYIELERMF